MKIKALKTKRFKTSQEAFLAIKRLFKSQMHLAKKCGVCQQTISKWERKGVPIRQAIILEKAVNGYVTRFDLRPDFFVIEKP